MTNTTRLLASAAALALVAAANPATAQDSSGPAATNDSDSGVIIVTARKQAEDLQRTPVAVSALSGDLIERSGAQELDAIDNFVPNVELGNVTYSSNTLGASIRGLSFSDLEKTFDPTVGVSIDGVFLAYSTGALVDLDDVASIEVLRGPQGTLYGRNTIGGTINIRRTRPTGELGLKVKARYSSYNNFETGAIANAPLVKDVLALKLSYNRQRGDSFTRNVLTDKRDGGAHSDTFGGALLFTPGSAFDALLSVDYRKDKTEYPPALNLTQPGELFCDLIGAVEPSACKAGSFDIAAADEFRKSFGAIPFTTPSRTFAATLEMNLRTGAGTFTSVSGYRHISETLQEENTGTLPVNLGFGPVPLVAAFRPQRSHQVSQEVRFASDFDGPLNFVAGLYYLDARYHIFPEDNPLGTGPGEIFILGGPAQVYDASQETTEFAGFGEATYHLTDRLRLSAGLRLSHQKKHFTLDIFDPATLAPTLQIDAQKSWTDPSYRVLLDYQFSPQVFGYASLSRGVRSGGFNGRAVSATSVGPYNPEKVDSYEVGLRMETADRRLTFNPTAFFSKYNDKQEELLVGLPNGTTETTVFNAANVDIWGAELEASLRPIDHLTLRTAAGYLDYRYSNFLALDPRPLSPTAGTIIDISDTARLRAAPKWTLAVGADYSLPVAPQSEVVITGNYKYTGRFQSGSSFFDAVPDPRGIRDARNVFDLSLTLKENRADSHLPFDLNISLYGRDIFGPAGRNGRPFNALPNFYFTNVEQARTFGIEVTANY